MGIAERSPLDGNATGIPAIEKGDVFQQCCIHWDYATDMHYTVFCCISATYSQSQQLPWNWASYQSWAGELLTVDGALVTVGFFTCDQILLSQNSLFVLCLLSSSCSSKTCRVCFHWYRLVKMYKKPLPVPQSLWIRHLQMAIMYRFAGTLHLCDSVTLKILSSNSACVYALCS